MPALPVIPQAANNWLLQPNAQQAIGMFPPNLVAALPEEIQKEITLYIYQKYAWPQVLERYPFERMWDKLKDMYLIKLDKADTNIDEASPAGKDLIDDKNNSASQVRVADSVVFDAIERLTCMTHFVSWKDGMPIQYNIPKYFDSRSEDAFYHPFRDKIKAANAMLSWNIDNQEVYRKHALATRQFYTYGITFVRSIFELEIQNMTRMTNKGRPMTVPEITAIGTTFDPLSIRKTWMNWRLSASDIQYQPCPFFFNETPKFATLQNQYDPSSNPFGFLNLDKVNEQDGPVWLYTSPEMQSIRRSLEALHNLGNHKQYPLTSILEPKHSVESLWEYYPMLPLDPQTGEWKVRKDGKTPVPFYRYIVNTWGYNLVGNQILLRLQRNFYPRDEIPLYASSHLPDLESGLYPPSIGYLLWNHYREVTTCKNQWLTNKDWINNPPTTVLNSSPAQNENLTQPGQKITVNSHKDIEYRNPYDATNSTVQMLQHMREQAKTTAKSDDNLLGQPLGGRTSASEASNIYQASMSAIVTPINLFNFDIMGGYAYRVWDYTASWFPPSLLESITGQMGFVLKPEDLWIRVGLKWDIGSTYIESMARQNNIRYILESSAGDPSINRAPMWAELLEEMRFDTAAEWVNDGGFNKQVFIATDQAVKTFLGQKVIINPDQNHQIAIRVKTGFLEDQNSVFMTQYRDQAQELVNQIEIHQRFLMLQMHMQLLHQQLNNNPDLPPPSNNVPRGAPPLQTQNSPVTAGQAAQMGGAPTG